ncbi:uncharacterized protein LOC123322613 [Coccinella septempunctata]|uniref:uncharacterized protein LOC123310236 n=1 Tax=Coccinella septempunctata TaxID=41139 RepID=UPI001D0706AE|nr:uncharacterized protein LOC123310236 [Coccinella septempunctata]XP_044758268.1 uncharacterized protein LOC123316321 [Coccinella septempunctata]XP_044766503.1 uncharacterized protein LOC123322613 [Coccinella septempunctata]
MMESVIMNPLICGICQKEFSSISVKNRHLRQIHNEDIQKDKNQHVLCCLCPAENREKFSSYKNYENHLKSIHDITVKESIFHFRSSEHFEAWRGQENRDVDYAFIRTCKTTKGDTLAYYNCNRSNHRGYESVCEKRKRKIAGSIHIQGVCPSRIIVKISTDGLYSVTFVETHVGHDDDLRTKRLSKLQQNLLVEKLCAGIPKERIMKDARDTVQNGELERFNIITRADLAYLVRKYNINKIRHDDDMVATALKVNEWNQQGKNFAFLFKKIGEPYPGLRDEDFALGFMNGIMEKKIRDFKNIICVDGTHGTNRNNWDLTIVLVKDENNMGFPVAFLLSNRLDQTIQEHFFSALKLRLGGIVDCNFFMSDDDPKYYNAWVKVMSSEQKPRRLLCTWHIIKNWNLQGKSKIRNPEIKKQMKQAMRKILKETDSKKFTELKDHYFNFLEREGENEFLKYLQNYYFQTEERVMMWAHCHRLNAGINTNMAIESLNKVLKYNKMRGQRNLRVEKLLDLLDELVEEKMWKKIINEERPNANNYQHKITVEAHKKAEQMNISRIETHEFGYFKVPSSSVTNKFYVVSYKDICDYDCRAGFCDSCKVCIHRYVCECSENAVKSVLCKHIHAVSLLERRSESVLGSRHSEDDRNNLIMDEPSGSKLRYQDELNHFMQEKHNDQTSINTDEETRKIAGEQFIGFINKLSGNDLNKFLSEVWTLKRRMEKDTEQISKKRKVEKQSYFPNKK